MTLRGLLSGLLLVVITSCCSAAGPPETTAPSGQSEGSISSPDPPLPSPSGDDGRVELADIVASGPEQGIESVYGAELGLSAGGQSPLGPIESFADFGPTIVVSEDGHVEGNLGCRAFSARIDLVAGNTTVVDLVVHELPVTPSVPFCETRRLLRAEERYAAALSDIDSIGSFTKVIGYARLPLSMSGPRSQLDFEELPQ